MLYRSLVILSLILEGTMLPASAQAGRTVASKTDIASAKVTTSSQPSRSKSPSDPDKVVAIEVLPSKLALNGVADSRRLLIRGRLGDGRELDLTHEAKLVAMDQGIRIDPDGFVFPVKDGDSRISVDAQ